MTDSNPSLAEFLAQAQRGIGGGYMGRVSGPLPGYLFGPDFLRKQTYLQISDTFTATYGKKVWDALNNRTVTFNAIKKVDWGPTVGWRQRTDRGSGRSRPITEAGVAAGSGIPTIDNSAYVGVYAYPKQIASTFGVSLKSQAVSALEGGIGNQFAVEQEATSRDHIKEINQELVAGSTMACSGNGTATSILTNQPTNARIGDTWYFYNASASAFNEAQGGVISAISSGSITVSTLSAGTTAADLCYIYSRNGLTSIDDITMQDNVLPLATKKAAANIYSYSGTVNGTATAFRRDTTLHPYAAAASCSFNGGTGRALTLALVDTAVQKIREAGGEPKLIVMGLDQYDKFNQLLQAQQRFMDVSDYVVGVGDERTYPGTRAGFQLATYRGIPILPDPDTTKSYDTSYAALGSNIYVLDTDYMEIAVMYPTQYIENRDYFAANALVIRGLFITMMENRCLRPDCQASIHDLSA